MNLQRTFTATFTHNTRLKHLDKEHYLFTNIYYADSGDIFRDHCWIKATKELANFRPKTNLYKIRIEFKAYPKKYAGTDGDKFTLTRLSEIKKIKYDN